LGSGLNTGPAAYGYTSPTQVSGTSASWTWNTINENYLWGIGIKTDGTLWTWGKGLYSGPNYGDPDPVQIQAGGTAYNDWTQVTAGYNYMLAIRSNGTFWTLGANSYGQGGTNNTDSHASDRTSLIQVGTDTNWALVASTGYASLAIRTDGTLWAWGRGTFGQLGLGDTANRSSPTQVGALTTWSKLPTFVYSTSPNTVPAAAIKTNGTLWTWGYNASGQLGQGDTTNRRSPVQVGAGTGWSSITMSGNSCLAISG
jgi:hypothetical protein